MLYARDPGTWEAEARGLRAGRQLGLLQNCPNAKQANDNNTEKQKQETQPRELAGPMSEYWGGGRTAIVIRKNIEPALHLQ